ncbi:MAG: 23S rRNA (guanosine(2251)-2'-O)-methyltransferase RlmB [Thiotrichales bacterium]
MAEREAIFGVHAVEAALRNDSGRIEQLMLRHDPGNKRLAPIVELARERRVQVQWVDDRALERHARGGRHQGVVAIYSGIAERNESDLWTLLDALDEAPLLLVLDGVTDPHNLGACLRTADAAGVHAVIAPRDQAVGITPVVRKVASGAAESVPFVQVTNLARTLDDIKQRGVWLVGTSDQADKSLYDLDLRGPIGLVMGAEGAGLRRLTQERCDYVAKLPMRGQVSSLNISVATGVCLYEALRQRR